MMKKFKIFLLKDIDYKRCIDFQNACRENLLKTKNKNFLIIAFHKNTITFGKNKIENDLLVNKNFLTENHIDLVDTIRGGKATCHGKGQVVFYPIINLKDFNLNIRDYVSFLENVLINTLGYFNIQAETCNNMEGVFIKKNDTLYKIGFIGIHVKKYHTMYGISVNIENDILKLFEYINPCGYKTLKITSAQKILKKKISYDLFIKHFINEFLKIKDKNKCKSLVD